MTRGRHLPQLPAAVLAVADRVPVAAIVLVLGASVVTPGWVQTSALAIAAVGLLIGLPHGAVDHLVPAWIEARRTPAGLLTVLLIGYVGAAGAMFSFLHVAPQPALAVFVLLSLWHFGSGEVTYAALRQGRSTAGGLAVRELMVPYPVQVLAWGGAVVLLPLVRWPDEVAPLLDEFAPGTSALLTAEVRGVIAVVVLTAVAATVLELLVRSAGSRGSARSAGELVLLTTALLIAQPLVVFAVWFGLWHSLRHIVRLLAADPANASDLEAGRAGPPVRRFLRHAAAPTVLALAVLVTLVATAGSGTSFLTLDLQLLAALTVPHMAVVAWLDRQHPPSEDDPARLRPSSTTTDSPRSRSPAHRFSHAPADGL